MNRHYIRDNWNDPIEAVNNDDDFKQGHEPSSFVKAAFTLIIGMIIIAAIFGPAIVHAQTIVTPTRTSSYDWQCQDKDGNKLSDHQRFDTALVACLNNPQGDHVAGGTYRINRPTAPTPCPSKPADETRPQTCPSGTVGSWTQTRTYSSAATPTCWTASDWLPSSPSAGACTAPPPTSIATPTTLATSVEPGSNAGRYNITLTWAAVTDATTYTIERCTGSTCTNFATLATVSAPATQYKNSNLPSGFTWRYRVIASNATLTSSPSDSAAGTTPATTPPTTSGATASLSWTPPTQNVDGSALTDLAGYRIHYGKSSSALDQTVQLANPAITSFVIDKLDAGTWYFAVTAYASSGAESALSNIASKTI